MHIDNSGNIWLGTSDKGLLKYNARRWIEYNSNNSKLPENEILCMFSDSKSRLWISTYSGLCVISDSKWKVFKRFQLRLGNLLPHSYITSIFEDNSANIWLLTDHTGIRIYNQKGFTRYNYWNTDGAEINDPKCGLQDSQGNIWIGTQSFGGFLIKYNQEKWENIIFTSLPTSGSWLAMQFIKFDNEGNLWVSTNGTNFAMMLYNGKEWTTLTGKDIGLDGVNADVHDMEIDSKGNRWFISNKGLLKFDGKKWQFFRDSEPHKKNWIYYDYREMTIDNNDNIWIGTNNHGLLEFNGENWSRFNVENNSLPSNEISDLVAHNNALWFGAGTKLGKRDTMGNFIFYDSTNSQFPECNISKLIVGPNNSLIIGTYEYGIIIFDGADFQQITELDSAIRTLKILNHNQLKDLKKNKPIFCSFNGRSKITDIVFEENGAMWIGTDGKGLFRIYNNALTNYNELNSGLLTNRITSIVIDKDGYKWVGLFRKGISRFR